MAIARYGYCAAATSPAGSVGLRPACAPRAASGIPTHRSTLAEPRRESSVRSRLEPARTAADGAAAELLIGRQGLRRTASSPPAPRPTWAQPWSRAAPRDDRSRLRPAPGAHPPAHRVDLLDAAKELLTLVRHGARTMAGLRELVTRALPLHGEICMRAQPPAGASQPCPGRLLRLSLANVDLESSDRRRHGASSAAHGGRHQRSLAGQASGAVFTIRLPVADQADPAIDSPRALRPLTPTANCRDMI